MKFGVVPPRRELKQLRIAFDELVVVAPLEQVACVPMSPVEPARVDPVQSLHPTPDVRIKRFDE